MNGKDIVSAVQAKLRASTTTTRRFHPTIICIVVKAGPVDRSTQRLSSIAPFERIVCRFGCSSDLPVPFTMSALPAADEMFLRYESTEGAKDQMKSKEGMASVPRESALSCPHILTMLNHQNNFRCFTHTSRHLGKLHFMRRS